MLHSEITKTCGNTREIVKNEKEIHTTAAVTPQTAEIAVTVHAKCFVKKAKARSVHVCVRTGCAVLRVWHLLPEVSEHESWMRTEMLAGSRDGQSLGECCKGDLG